jgi:hypothetical protein
MKKFRKLIPALAMLLVSAVLMSTASYAWFSMNTQVTATGMQVKAVAEDGLLIKNELDADAQANWKASTNASYGSLVDLAPTSTADAETWYHNKSNDQTDAKAGQLTSTYTVLSDDTKWKRDTGSGKTGVYYIDTDNGSDKDENEKAYVLLNKFYIKSSGDAIALGDGKTYADLYVNKVIVGATSASAALDASLRVAVKVGSQLYIYAPVANATTTYKAGGSDSGTSVTVTTVPASGIVNSTTSTTSIPAVTATSGWVEADVYIFFEGEDAGLKSANLVSTLDTLTVEVIFGITTV